MNDVPHAAARDAPAPRTLPHSIECEQSVLGGIMLRNELLRDLPGLDVEAFYHHPHKAVFSAMKTLASLRKPIDIALLEHELTKAGKLEAVGDVAYLGQLMLKVPTVDNVHEYARTVMTLYRNRKAMLALGEALERGYQWPHDPSEFVSEVAGQMQRLLEDDPTRARWMWGPQLATEVRRARHDPWVAFRLGTEELCKMRVGGILAMIGGSGSGKTSLAASLLVQHAIDTGPAIALSIELPADEFGARVVGVRCGQSWEDVLLGVCREEFIDDALDLPRLCVLERSNATLENLADALRVARTKFPGQPIMVAIDYAQLVESDEWEARAKVADVFKRIDALARRERVAVIALSQMGRMQAREVRSGERIGAETSDTGAESAAIERFASVTVAIGKKDDSPDSIDEEIVELSIGKLRMGKGDRVLPGVFRGKSGAWSLTGESKPADEVRAQRAADKERKQLDDAKSKILQEARTRREPASRRDLSEAVQGKRELKYTAIRLLVETRALVEVAKHAPRSKTWLVWTPDQAKAAGLTLVDELGDQLRLDAVAP
jgi:replicative DNA helicase